MNTPASVVLNRNPPYKDTSVSCERTKAEIEILLKSYGIKAIRWTTVEGEDDILEFAFDLEVYGVKKQLGIRVSPPHIVVKKRVGGEIKETENINQEYRLLFHWIKSKIEAVVWGLSTIEREFLSDIVWRLPDGRETTFATMVMDIVSENSLQSLPFYGHAKEQPRLPPRNITLEGQTP